MSTERGRIQITGFDAEAVEERDSLSEWTEKSGSETETRWQRGWRRFKRNRTAMIGIAVVTVMALAAIFVRPIEVMGVAIQPLSISGYGPNETLFMIPDEACQQRDASRPCVYHPPTADYLFGTDHRGQDLFTRVLVGGRYSMSIGFIVVGLTGAFGLVYGGVSGYYGGWVDEILMRIVDTIYAFPPLILALILVAVLGGSYWTLVLAFTLFGWAGYGRLVRGEVLSIKENEYVMAAKALGARDRSIIFRHVLPNAMPPLLVLASLNIGTVVIGVAALGFLGLGMDPGTAEWGTMLDATRETLVQGPGGAIPWWATVFPGGAIFLFVMSMNMIGDGVNDALDAQQTGVGQGGE